MEQEMIFQKQAMGEGRVTVVFTSVSLPVTFHQSVKIHVGHNWSTSVDFVPYMSCWRGCWQITCASSMEGCSEWFLDAQKYCHSLCAGERSDCNAVKIFSAFRGRKLEVLHHFRRSGDMLKESALEILYVLTFLGRVACGWAVGRLPVDILPMVVTWDGASVASAVE